MPYPTIVDSDTMAKSNAKAFQDHVDSLGQVQDVVQEPLNFSKWADQQGKDLFGSLAQAAAPSPDTQQASQSPDVASSPPSTLGVVPAPTAAPTPTPSPASVATPTPAPAPPVDAASFGAWADQQGKALFGSLGQSASNVKQDVSSDVASVGQAVNSVAKDITSPPPVP